ncbi:MAG: gamma-glutamyltransferase [Gammaproteobacteria bacterium]|nr:gamma-glutamyltransferase [Gammaproteobacteria bacterium]NNF50772.1 gamma-glutamyltransferase [Woeseiaceae bacterium]MBT8094399.1 gamma-glutamyltransferase [Gammaproteobacteria bacterium]MBT8104965.1 gamma-glutamyltransferase [Gammaproteobacteria bacterium]NNK24979.1 gamma-glutamyltransferase [Woeseiaceae bacterium]
MQRPSTLLIVITLALAGHGARAQLTDAPIIRYEDTAHPQFGEAGMVSSQNALSSAVGAEILAQGGNAVDAAIAVGFSLAVTLPRAGNLGGGGFMLVHHGESGKDIAIDYRERAPVGASRDMYLDDDGNVDEDKLPFGHLAAGVPGSVSGLFRAHQEFGTLPWRQLVEPAIRQAHQGVIVSYDMATLLKARKDRLCGNEAACSYFYKEGGVPYEPGELFVQRDLAETLERIARFGPDGFYKGKTAALIAADMAAHGGLVDEESLAAYETVVREPLRGNYRGYEIMSMPPPSSGGVHLIQMLNILEHFPVRKLGAGSADNVHLLTESARLAYADRAVHLGDPEFHDVPVEWLTSKQYARQLADGIDLQQARDSRDVGAGTPPPAESPDTTHYSVIDSDGNIVAATTTLNFSFGAAVAVSGAGFLMNNEMDDFVAKPGVPNGYGLLGGEANAIAPLKRPLSSMTPTIVFDEGEAWFAIGSPGGSRIITTVLQAVVNVIDHEMNLAEAINAPRMHHQWMPDVLQLESGFSPDTIGILKRRGHDVKAASYSMGSVQAVGIRDGFFVGASDLRRPNAGSQGPTRVPDR